MKKIVSLIMSLTILLSMFTFVSVISIAEIFNDYNYTVLDDGTVEITRYEGSATELQIPSEIDGKKVTCIGDIAFNNNRTLTSIIIPDSVTSIGDEAFCYCTSLTSITIPNSITSISAGMFMYCKSLTSITIPESVTSIDESAFFYCTSLTNVTIPGSVKSIKSEAFYNCTSLTSIMIPDSVTNIEYAVFNGCSLLTDIFVSPNNRNYCDIDGVLFNKSKTELIQFPKGKDITFYAIPDSVKDIGKYAFYDCGLTNINIPMGVINICNNAFNNSSLTSVIIPDSVTSIGDEAFLGYGLTKVVIGNGVTSIGRSAFKNRTITSLTIGNSVKSIGEAAFGWCELLKSINIPVSVTYIGNYAFATCDSLRDIYYSGAEEQWKAIKIGEYGYGYINATIHYNYNQAHNYISKIIKQPTCTETGTKTYTCSECGDSYTEIIPMKAHTEVFIPGKSATCTEAGLTYGIECSVCNRTLIIQQEIAPTGHKYNDVVITKKPTCTATGEKTYTCSQCGDSYTEILSAIGHNEVIIPGKAASCTESGLTEGKKCSVCDKVIVKQETIPATGHNEVITPAKAATCVESGLTQGKKCSLCDKVIVKQEIIPAVPHDFAKKQISSTCIEKGYTIYTCKDCGFKFKSDYTLPKNHVFVSKIITEPTCTKEGERLFVCTACGESYTDKIVKTGHKYKVVTTKATYFSNGKTDYKCACGKIQKTVTIKKLVLKTPSVKVTSGKKKFIIKYTKVKDATGFEIKYKVGKKTIVNKIKTAKSLKKTISKLKKGKYTLKIRAYKQSGKKYAYSKTVTKKVTVR